VAEDEFFRYDSQFSGTSKNLTIRLKLTTALFIVPPYRYFSYGLVAKRDDAREGEALRSPQAWVRGPGMRLVAGDRISSALIPHA